MMSFMTFSAPMGFMNAGGDVQGIIKSLEWDTKYFALVGLPVSRKQEETVSNLSDRWVRSHFSMSFWTKTPSFGWVSMPSALE